MRSVFPLLVSGAALIVGFSGNALWAQNQAPSTTDAVPGSTPVEAPTHRAPDPLRQTRRMAKQLALTPDQQAQIEPVLADRQQQIQSVRADSALPPQDRRMKVRGILQASDIKIQAILNDAQKQKYVQIKAHQRARRDAQYGGSAG